QRLFRACSLGCTPTTSKILGTPHRHEPRTPLARPGQGEGSARTAGSGLRVVHGGFRHARSEGSEVVAGATSDMSGVRKWLETVGLAQYADAFEANDIDIDLLTQVDDQLLKDMGVSSAGHRLRIRNAIATLGAQVQSGSADGPLMSAGAASAER